MYQTQKAAYVDFSALGSDSLHWRYVEHTLNAPWFYIPLTRNIGTEQFKTMLQTMDPAVLTAVVGSSLENIEIGDVMLVTPSFMNGTETWQMEKLIEFAQCHSKIFGSFDVFRVAGDRVYATNTEIGPDGLDEVEKSVIYKSL